MSPITTRRVRHTLRARRLVVAERIQITPTRVRLILGGDLSDFCSASADDHIKLILPDEPGREPTLPQVGPDGVRFTPGERRPAMRDYTPRRVDAAAGLLTVEFTIHGTGPASSWARAARVGDPIGQVGPRGSLIVEGVERWCLAGDESALPAIARRIDELGPTQRAQVLVATSDPPSAHGLPPTSARVQITWLPPSEGGDDDPLLTAITSWEPPRDSDFVWVATEADSARGIRAHLRNERGLTSDRMRVTGYWRRGIANHHDE